MKATTTRLIGLVLAGSSCCASTDPIWVRELTERLECGMSVSEIRALASREVKETTTQPRFGTYRVDGKHAEVWLEFEKDKLVAVVSGRVHGLTSLRISPKRNLCTEALTFWIRIEWVERLQGADVLLDGVLVEANANSGLIVEASGGRHDIRIVKSGFEPITTVLDLGPDDPGEYYLEISSEDVRANSNDEAVGSRSSLDLKWYSRKLTGALSTTLES